MDLGGIRRFDGQVAAVTGAGSGIGKATASRLCSEGAFVYLLDVDAQAAESAARSLPNACALQVDVSDAEAVSAVVAAIVRDRGHLDVMVANAGVTLEAAIFDTTPSALTRVLDVNLAGAFFCAGSAIDAMRDKRSGSVVMTSSDAGLMGWPAQAAYCASKGAIVALARAAALDAAPFNVRVNCVCPGFTSTPLVEDWIAQAADPEAARSEVAATQPIGRMARPEEIAAAIVFLASEEARFVTGVALAVDGGVTAQ